MKVLEEIALRDEELIGLENLLLEEKGEGRFWVKEEGLLRLLKLR